MFWKSLYLFAAPDEPNFVEKAKSYIKEMGFTKEDVMLYREGGQVIVEARRDIA